tara:strand:- start:98 stop:625 length:528 start_codon:yes stop_codon:yes gene_type:complete
MKKIFKKTCIISICLLFSFSNLFADNSHFIDFSKVLNNSTAGAKAQSDLKNKFESDNKKFKKLDADLRKEETEIISQKTTLSKEDYQSKLNLLRKRVSKFQKDKRDSLQQISISRSKFKLALLKEVNPIIKKYMEEKNIRIVLDKQGVILGDAKLEITDQIIEILNKELSSLKIN